MTTQPNSLLKTLAHFRALLQQRWPRDSVAAGFAPCLLANAPVVKTPGDCVRLADAVLALLSEAHSAIEESEKASRKFELDQVYLCKYYFKFISTTLDIFLEIAAKTGALAKESVRIGQWVIDHSLTEFYHISGNYSGRFIKKAVGLGVLPPRMSSEVLDFDTLFSDQR